MRSADSLDLSVVIVRHADVLVRHSGTLPEQHVQAYWTASRSRHHRWGQALRQLADTQTLASPARYWARADALFEEILRAEVTTRIWGAVLEGLDDYVVFDEYGPIARSVFGGHLELRHRVLNHLLEVQPRCHPRGVALNRRRADLESLTDLLLSLLPKPCPVHCYAHAPRLMCQSREGDRFNLGISGATILSSRLSAHTKSSDDPADNRLRQRIADAITGAFSTELFGSTGAPRSWMQASLRAAPDDQIGQISNWLDRMLQSAPDNKPGSLGRF